MARANPVLLNDILKLGAFDVTACFSCGVCTATCPLVEEGGEFPRRLIRYVMLGLEDKLLGAPELWVCYYCGECTRSCPRQADPGGFMMAARRFAVTKYSIGKIGKVFYDKIYGSIALAILSLIMALGIWWLHNPILGGKVDLFEYLNENYIHEGGLVLGVYVGVVALANIVIMLRYLFKSGNIPKAGIGGWVKGFIDTLFAEVLWQGRYDKCDSKGRFVSHMGIFWGFVLLMIATTIDYVTGARQLSAMVLGAIGGVLITVGGGYFIWIRLAKKDEYSTYSDFVDWMFIWLVFLAGITGFLIDLFAYYNLQLTTYTTFAIHLIVVFDLIVTAPFTKFAHAGYRPLAVWIYKVARKPQGETAGAA